MAEWLSKTPAQAHQSAILTCVLVTGSRILIFMKQRMDTIMGTIAEEMSHIYDRIEKLEQMAGVLSSAHRRAASSEITPDAPSALQRLIGPFVLEGLSARGLRDFSYDDAEQCLVIGSPEWQRYFETAAGYRRAALGRVLESAGYERYRAPRGRYSGGKRPERWRLKRRLEVGLGTSREFPLCQHD